MKNKMAEIKNSEEWLEYKQLELFTTWLNKMMKK